MEGCVCDERGFEEEKSVELENIPNKDSDSLFNLLSTYCLSWKLTAKQENIIVLSSYANQNVNYKIFTA